MAGITSGTTIRTVQSCFILIVCIVMMSLRANAQSCWYVNGWTSTSLVGAQAQLIPTRCDMTPPRSGWVQVRGYPYMAQPIDTLWLRIPLNDRHVSGWSFRPRLFFKEYDSHSRPVIVTDLSPDDELDSNGHSLTLLSPIQGVAVIGAAVRLRHLQTEQCLYSEGNNGAFVHNRPCNGDVVEVYVIDDAGDGYVRLRHQQTGQCLYTISSPFSDAPLHNWQCWDDPNMQFKLIKFEYGVALQHKNTFRCVFGDGRPYGNALTSACYIPFLFHAFNLDIVAFPSQKDQHRAFRAGPPIP